MSSTTPDVLTIPAPPNLPTLAESEQTPLRSESLRRAPISPLGAILILGLIVRLMVWGYLRNEPIRIWDEQDYNTLALNIVRTGEFTFSPGDTPTSLRPPLYPAMIAVIYQLFGEENFAAVRLIQSFLSLLTVILVYRLAREATSQRTATVAAGLFCLYPSLVLNTSLLLTETLFTLLLTGSCLWIVMALRHASLAAVAGAGITLGLAALTRSVVWLAPPFLAVFLIVCWSGKWQRLLAASLLIVCFAATISPWAIRNTRLQQTFVAIDVMGGRNFMMGNYQHTPLYRSWDAIALEGEQSWWHEVHRVYPPEIRQTQGQVDKLALRQGLNFVLENPGLTAKRSLVKFFDFWGLERELVAGAGRGFYGPMERFELVALTAVIVGSYVAAICLGIFGVFLAPLPDRRAHWLFLCVIAFICGLHVLAFGHSRYHLPLMPFVLIFSANALTHARMIWGQRTTGRFMLAGLCCAILTAGWIWSFIAVDWERFAAAWKAAT
jgi:4-amino-4-deoxy-L-arabinose transferase-like glycosyltransferase